MVDIGTAITLGTTGGTTETGALTTRDKAAHYARRARAKETKRAYKAHWSAFVEWCEEEGVMSLPALPATVSAYAADLADTHRPGSIQAALSAISQAHKLAHFDSPTLSPEVRIVMAGIRREKGTAQAGKRPLLTDDLRAIVRTLPKGLKGTRDAALLLLTYAGAFRRSEVVSLNAADVEFSDDGLVVTLRRSKTDQEGQGRRVGIPYGSTPQTCPVRSLRRWLDAAGITDGPLFRSVNRHGHVSERLTPQSVALVVKSYAAMIGKDVDLFGAHSLRAGFATQAAKNGANERDIMTQTGHRSLLMVRRYIREGNLFRDNAAMRLGL